MTKQEKIQEALYHLVQNTQITPCDKQDEWNTQYHSAIRLAKKNGFQARYNLLFRLSSMWLASQGYELTRNKPHQTLNALNSLVIGKEINDLMKARHENKYNGTPVKRTLEEKLNTIINQWATMPQVKILL